MNLKEMINYWQDVRKGLNQALDQISDEELHFRPREELWSLGQVVRHIAATEDGWYGYIAEGRYEDWPPEPTHEDAPTVADLQDLLAEVHARILAYLEPLTDADLERTIQAYWGAQFPLSFVVWHVLEHEIHHRGEVYLMLGLLGREAPDV